MKAKPLTVLAIDDGVLQVLWQAVGPKIIEVLERVQAIKPVPGRMVKVEWATGMPVEEARGLAWDLAKDKGLICPCCLGVAKVYARTTSRSVAKRLVELFYKAAENRDAWHHYTDLGKTVKSEAGGAYGHLYQHGLVESSIDDDLAEWYGDFDARLKIWSDGKWRISDEGIEFVEGNSTIPKHIYRYNGVTLGCSSKRVTIHQVLAEQNTFQKAEIGRSAKITILKDSIAPLPLPLHTNSHHTSD